MSKATLTVTVPEDVTETDAISVIEQMIEEFFYANREHLGEVLERINYKIEGETK